MVITFKYYGKGSWDNNRHYREYHNPKLGSLFFIENDEYARRGFPSIIISFHPKKKWESEINSSWYHKDEKDEAERLLYKWRKKTEW